MHLPVAAFSNKIYAYYLQELHHPNTLAGHNSTVLSTSKWPPIYVIPCSVLRKYSPDGPPCLEQLVPSTNGMGWGVTDWTGVVTTNHRDEMLNVWHSNLANIPMLFGSASLLAAYKEFISHEREFKIFTVLKSPREALTPWNVQAALLKLFFFL